MLIGLTPNEKMVPSAAKRAYMDIICPSTNLTTACNTKTNADRPYT
jgi:hypothetical protein